MWNNSISDVKGIISQESELKWPPTRGEALDSPAPRKEKDRALKRKS